MPAPAPAAAAPATYHLYGLRHEASGNMYYGVTTDVKRRWRQHRSKPLLPIQRLLQAEGTTVAEAFTMQLLNTTCCEWTARAMERDAIAAAQRAGLPIFNTCSGHPAHCKKWQAIRIKQRQRSQKP